MTTATTTTTMTGEDHHNDEDNLAETLVACNVYVSAGGGDHRRTSESNNQDIDASSLSSSPPSSTTKATAKTTTQLRLLTKLLKNAQKHCRELSLASARMMCNGDATESTQPKAPVVVVHAFADPIYDRSSFHIAGPAKHVARVASSLANDAIHSLQLYRQSIKEEEQHSAQATTAHPNVGLVDHIAVMPLIGHDEAGKGLAIQKQRRQHEQDEGRVMHDGNDNENDDDESTTLFIPWTASGFAARYIGHSMMRAHGDSGLHVLYYGSAHPHTMPLADVRRHHTDFFKSGGLLHETGETQSETQASKQQQQQQQQQQQRQIATVGAPLYFVENYNIRLSRTCTKNMARSLTKYVRERDGISNLVGVEALTLPYSDGRYEVACNLLRPDLASSNDVQVRVNQWEQEQQQTLQDGSEKKLVECAYRVGTTATQCLRVLELLSSATTTNDGGDDEERKQHDTLVLERFKEYIKGEQQS